MVIFISDENDVCYDYFNENKKFAQKGMRRRDIPQIDSSSKNRVELNGIFRDQPEHGAFIGVCASGQKGTADVLSNMLRAVKHHSNEVLDNLPIITTGVLYSSLEEQNQAQAKKEKYWGDNEMGHGYLNLIHEMNGETTSLLSKQFGKELANMGQLALFKMTFIDEIPIVDNRNVMIDLSDVVIENIAVEITTTTGETISLVQGVDYRVETKRLTKNGPLVGTVKLFRSTSKKLDWTNAIVQVLY